MAYNWASSLSNYFKVKDVQAFKAWLSNVAKVRIAYESDDYIAIAGDDFGGWPTGRGRDHKWFDFVEELSGFLAEGEIAVLTQVGAEEHQYIGGYSVAVDWKGKRTEITLSDIYAQAEASFGRRPQHGPY